MGNKQRTNDGKKEKKSIINRKKDSKINKENG